MAPRVTCGHNMSNIHEHRNRERTTSGLTLAECHPMRGQAQAQRRCTCILFRANATATQHTKNSCIMQNSINLWGGRRGCGCFSAGSRMGVRWTGPRFKPGLVAQIRWQPFWVVVERFCTRYLYTDGLHTDNFIVNLYCGREHRAPLAVLWVKSLISVMT